MRIPCRNDKYKKQKTCHSIEVKGHLMLTSLDCVF